ncbi:Lnb N-terminal periplasmic domain-containing protein [Marinobacter confluentis]|uniref:DUF4105 domain-containing protein n=1 Tax=Marinobacter confluentis TaxID=1697557 RepID=A0A4Z1BS65_9GAMM|nr:DUF4105 domain-containing protein [Marinobacter confluentis]TGN40535.1 DUF4105 domain-containing protein [Marinobacter confluentis]
MRTKLQYALALSWLASSLHAFATPLPDTGDLHQHPAWLTLVHYQPDRFSSGYTGQADDDDFFLSPRGKTSPEAELKATLEAITQPGGGDDHARCRFPARDQWLRQQLDLPQQPADCPAYDQWMEELNTETVTLVFAASYLNSPSSMFGHTFLRLDPPREDDETNLILANTISYAADAAAHDSEILFAYKGIFGGYPGITSIQPYYEKIRLYSDIEHRDLWEYQLNLTQPEVDMMLAHTWEIRDRNFDYYFFDENCAYRLLALIDVARPGTDLLSEVSTHAIPSDTVRWVVDRNLVADVTYRPSAATKVNHSIESLPDDHQTLAAAIANGYVDADAPEVKTLNDEERARVLDTTYDYVRYQSEADGWPREHAAPLSHDLLRERSRIRGVDAQEGPQEPEIRDDQGHDTFRASLSGGRLGERNFTELTLRPAYHDILDPPAGYRGGAQLQFLRLDARLYTDNDELQIEQLTGVEIRSLSPRNQFFSPLSWQVGFGGRRTDTETRRVFTPYLEGGAGFSWQLATGTQAFALGTADLEIDDDLRRGYDAAPGADLGILHQNNRFSLLGGVKTKAWIVSSQHRQDQAYLEANWHIGRDFSLFGKFSREDHYDRYRSEWQLGLHAYF